MNLTKITLLVALLGALTSAMAAQTNNSNSDIDAQITKIQNAPAQERVQLMNKFKQQLANMKQADRMQAISQMQKKMHGHAIDENIQHNQHQADNKKEHAQEMVQGKQSDAMKHINRMQKMSHKQEDRMDNIKQMQQKQKQKKILLPLF